MAVGPAGPVGSADRVELFGGMRLTRKFIAALVIGVALVALVQGFLDYRRERSVFDRQMRAEASALGRALARGMAEVWERDGEAAAREFLIQASNQGEHITARWVWLDSTVRDVPAANKESLAALKSDQVVVIKDERRNRLLTYIPVDVQEPRDGAIEIAQPLAELDKYTADSLRNEALGSVSAVVLAAALAISPGRCSCASATSGASSPPRSTSCASGSPTSRRRARSRPSSCATPIGSPPSASSRRVLRTSSARRSTSSRDARGCSAITRWKAPRVSIRRASSPSR